MTTRFVASIKLRGANGKTIPLPIDLGEFSEVGGFPEDADGANTALTAILAELADVTDAVVAETRLSAVFPGSASTPASGDLFEKAMVNVWSLNEEDTNAVEHVAQIYIPAPKIGLFQTATGPGRDVVDVTDADLVAYVASLAANAEISDGETIQTGTGTDGMLDGRRVVIKQRLGR